jgi:flagellar FliL protein
MRTVDEAKLSEDTFRTELAEKLKMAINSVLEKYEDFGGVEEVLFTEFVVQ